MVDIGRKYFNLNRQLKLINFEINIVIHKMNRKSSPLGSHIHGITLKIYFINRLIVISILYSMGIGHKGLIGAINIVNEIIECIENSVFI